MGIYLNPGNMKFSEAVASQIYVDKTEMISYLNTIVHTEQKYVSVSRPRRFGKSIAANMLCAYYGKGDSRQQFGGLKLGGHEDWDRYLNKFDVIKIVMTDFIKGNKPISASLQTLTVRLLDDLEEAYPDVNYDPEDLVYSMNKFYRKSQVPFVIIIDEWDAVFRERKEDKEGQKLYLDFLRDWLKDKEYVALAYMTGILPIKKYGQHSALNMFREFSIIAPMQFAPYTGFTKEEVKALCEEYNVRYEDISRWYDGYVVNTDIPIEMREKYRAGEYEGKTMSIYSPLSVVEAVSTGVIQNYWNKTENYEALAEYIRMDYDGLKDAVALLMDGGRVSVDTSTYQNDMTTFHGRDDVLTMLIHLGYLGYDMDTKKVFIPNNEILDEFKASTKSEEWVDTFKAFRKSQELLKATWKGDADKPALLVELKYDKNIKTAADQIRSRNYPQKLEHYEGNLLLVSVNYEKELASADENYKRHSCRIEKL